MSKDFLTVLSLRTVGNFMVFFSLFLIVKTLFQPAVEELRFFYNDITKRSYTVSETKTETKPASTGFGSFFQQEQVEVLVPEDPEFSLVIPKIGANAKVVKNVDAGNEEEYLDALKYGIAHAKGTQFPGESGHTFLFAHSTDYIWNIGSYNAVFYLLYKLEKDDEVNVFYKGQRYVYQVTDKAIITADQTEYLTRTSTDELLTLQTCWPPGTTLKRLVVTAIRKAE
jgi:sortase A